MSESGREVLDEMIRKALNYAANEFDMDYGETIGILEMIVFELKQSAYEEKEGPCEDLGI